MRLPASCHVFPTGLHLIPQFNHLPEASVPMKNFAPTSRLAVTLQKFAVFGLLFFASFMTTYGQTTTFAQFFERFGTQDFIFTNNTTSADFNAVSGGSQIFFIYSNITGLDPSLQGIQNARLFITTTTNQSATLGGGSVSQPLNQIVTVQIIRDTPAPVGSGSRTNLLTAVFTPAGNTPAIVGSNGGNSATLSATTPDHNVTFTSDFLLFGLTSQRNLAFSFSSVAPSLGISGNFLQSFAAAGSGTFASSPPPVPFTTSAAGVSVGGRVTYSNGRAMSNASVYLTETDGTMHSARTNSFGYFNFKDIESGQTVFVSVRTRQYTSDPMAVDLSDNISDLVFVVPR